MSSNKKTEAFVSFVIKRVSQDKDKAFGAKLKRAESESTEYQSWEILSKWVDLESEKERKAYALIGASIARTVIKNDGNASVGAGLRLACKDEVKTIDDLASSSSSIRLRKLLSCKKSSDLILALRPILHLLESKQIELNYSRLLEEIMFFDSDSSREWTCIRWAQDFFGKKREDVNDII